MSRITTKTIRQIRELRRKGWRFDAIAVELRIHETTARKYESDVAYAAAVEKEKRRYAKKVEAKRSRRKT
jgi:hypothetical protein